MASDRANRRAPAKLAAPRADVERELVSQISKGHGYRALSATTDEELRVFTGKVRGWSEYNVELLQRRFTSPAVAEEYRAARPRPEGTSDVEQGVEFLRKYLRDQTSYLSRLKERLSLYEDTGTPASTDTSLPTIFVVHGRNRGAEQEVLRFLDRVADLQAVVLHDQPNRGRTIIEKFEDVAAKAAFVVVILTPDDEGRARNTTDLQPRARQNVLFELGYFFGKLGRESVAALYEPETEVPTDITGLAYIELDERGGWKIDLCREMRAAGLTVHTDRIV